MILIGLAIKFWSFQNVGWLAQETSPTSLVFEFIRIPHGDGSKPCTLVNIKIAGKWMFIPLKMVSIGIDP